MTPERRRRYDPSDMTEPLEQLRDAVLQGNAPVTATLTGELLAGGHDPGALLKSSLIPAMDEAGRRFEAGEYFLPELLVTARAMKAAMAQIQPLLAAAGARPAGHVVLGTVAGDLHDIGKNLVAAMLEGGGFQVTDLGADVPAERFVAAVHDAEAEIVGLSALLSTTMPTMKEIVDALVRAGVRERVRIMVGGAPITTEFAQRIGADGYAPDASQAVTLARRFRAQAGGTP